MARNINQIYSLVLYICRKERNVFITPSDFNEVIQAAQLEEYGYYFQLYAANQTIHDALSPFKVFYQFTTSSSGFATYPSDYQHLIAGVFTVTGSTVNPVRFVNSDQLPFALTNQLRPISTSSPIATDQDNGFQIYPQTTQTGFFNYLRLPNAPVLGYTQSGRTITYDPLTSTQIEFYDVYVNNIISRALKYFGINMDENGIIQYGQLQQQETQQQ